MMRVTPRRVTTLQCSQIGFTLLRTFTGTPKRRNSLLRPHFGAVLKDSRDAAPTQASLYLSPSLSRTILAIRRSSSPVEEHRICRSFPNIGSFPTAASIVVIVAVPAAVALT